MKEETLEEAASRLLYNKYPYHPPQDSGYWKDMFIEGTKWQQERMYSEEDLKEAYFSAIKSTGEGRNGEYANRNNPDIKKEFTEGFEEWFEQFKK